MFQSVSFYEIKKSKFAGFLLEVASETQVMEAVLRLKRMYPKATHICYAYRLTSPFAEKAVDAGEPSGTAGRPILSVLQKKDKQNCAIFVVRKFGGIQLGASGLVRAYTKTASMLFDTKEK